MLTTCFDQEREDMRDCILGLVAQLFTPGFFVTVEFLNISTKMPQGIETFILQKEKAIHRGITARKFAYREGEWRLFFTFFPTDTVVDEKYAMKNVVIKSASRLK